MPDSNDEIPGTFPYVWDKFWRRTAKPVAFVNHWVYIVVGVVFLGGLGTLSEYYSLIAYQSHISPEDWIRCAKSLASYSLAVAGTAAVQMVLYEDGEDQLRAPAVALLSLVVLLSVPVLSNAVTIPCHAHVLSGTCAIIALLVCWIAAANNNDSPPADVTMGGPMPAVGGSSTLPSQPAPFRT